MSSTRRLLLILVGMTLAGGEAVAKRRTIVVVKRDAAGGLLSHGTRKGSRKPATSVGNDMELGARALDQGVLRREQGDASPPPPPPRGNPDFTDRRRGRLRLYTRVGARPTDVASVEIYDGSRLVPLSPFETADVMKLVAWPGPVAKAPRVPYKLDDRTIMAEAAYRRVFRDEAASTSTRASALRKIYLDTRPRRATRIGREISRFTAFAVLVAGFVPIFGVPAGMLLGLFDHPAAVQVGLIGGLVGVVTAPLGSIAFYMTDERANAIGVRERIAGVRAADGAGLLGKEREAFQRAGWLRRPAAGGTTHAVP